MKFGEIYIFGFQAQKSVALFPLFYPVCLFYLPTSSSPPVSSFVGNANLIKIKTFKLLISASFSEGVSY